MFLHEWFGTPGFFAYVHLIVAGACTFVGVVMIFMAPKLQRRWILFIYGALIISVMAIAWSLYSYLYNGWQATVGSLMNTPSFEATRIQSIRITVQPLKIAAIFVPILLALMGIALLRGNKRPRIPTGPPR